MARYTNYQPAETDEIVLYDVALDDEDDEEDKEDIDESTVRCPQNNIFVSIWNFVTGAFSSWSLSSGSCHRSPSDDPSA